MTRTGNMFRTNHFEAATRINLMDFSVCFYIFSIVIFDNSFIFYLAAGLLFFVGIIDVVNKKRIRTQSYFICLLLFILFNLFQTICFAYDSVTSFNRLLVVTLNFFLSFFVFNYAIVKEQRFHLYYSFIVSTLLLIVYLVVRDPSSLLTTRFSNQVPQPFGVGVNYNANNVVRSFYSSCIFCLLLAFEKKNNSKSFLSKFLLVFLFVVFFASTILTGSRTGILVILLSLFAYFLVRAKTISQFIKGLVFSALIALTVYLLFTRISFLYLNVGQRFEIFIEGLLAGGDYERKTSVFYRASMISTGIDLFLKKPFSGYGLDSFKLVSGFDVYSHNNYIEILVSSGVIGFILFYLPLLLMLVSLFKIRSKSVENKLILSFLFGSIICQFGYIAYLQRISLLLYALGAAIVWNDYNSVPNKSRYRVRI